MPTANTILGCGTALVTPFTREGEVDLESFRKLIDWQIESGIDFLVPCGTTGESVSLTIDEYRSAISACVEQSGGRVRVVAGAGSNNTAHAIELGRIARESGADALLSVAPYYNKPTQEGLFRHFQAIAQASPLPVVVYNVPGRTSSNVQPATLKRLQAIANVCAVKEASGDLGQIMQIVSQRRAGFSVLSGDDALTLPMAALGCQGVISVVSNLIPAQMSRLVRLACSGQADEARSLHYEYLDLMNLNFVESNPIPVKYALFRMGRIQESYRLPMCELGQAGRERMDHELERLNLTGRG